MHGPTHLSLAAKALPAFIVPASAFAVTVPLGSHGLTLLGLIAPANEGRIDEPAPPEFVGGFAPLWTALQRLRLTLRTQSDEVAAARNMAGFTQSLDQNMARNRLVDTRHADALETRTWPPAAAGG